MSWLDRFRTPSSPNTAPIGESGRMQQAGILIEDDHNPELTGLQGVRELDRMHRADADARGATRMVANPILASTWTIIPFGGEEADDRAREVADFVQWALFEHLGWRTHLWTVLDVVLPLGHAPFEEVWELADYQGSERWACCLDLRLPRSVYRFFQDDAGRLESIEQMTRKGMTRIPADQLVYYRLSARGDNWRGESLLRSAYKHFHYKEKLELIAAIAEEKFAVGTPIAYPPQGYQNRDELADVLANVRTHESGFIIADFPHAQYTTDGSGGVIDILMPKGEHDIVPLLNYHSGKISASVLEEFMRLGHANVGAKATAETQADPFMEFCEAISGVVIEDTINAQLIPKLVALNFPDAEGLPKLSGSVIDQTSVGELTEAVSKLVTAKAITVDPGLEDWLRDYMGMPTIDPEVRAQEEERAQAAADAAAAAAAAGGQQPPGDQPPTDGEDAQEPPAKLTLRRQSRPLTWWEDLMQLDRVEAAIDGARDRFIQAAQPITHQIAAQIAANPKRKTTPFSSELADAITGELQALYWTGRDTVQQELQAQRPSLTRTWSLRAADDQPPESLRMRAEAAAENVIARMVAAVKRDILARSKTSQASMQTAAEAAARGALRDEAQQHASFALNLGRTDEGDQNADVIQGARYTSVLDGNTCSACRQADDDILRPMDDPVRLERIPPNPDCEGGDKCRCMEFFQLMDELAPSA